MVAAKQKLIPCCIIAVLVFFLCAAPHALASVPSVEPMAIGTPTPAGSISKKQAKSIALQHAGLKKRQVKHLTASVTKRKQQSSYLIKFKRGSIKFTYSINVYDGTIISYSAHKAKKAQGR